MENVVDALKIAFAILIFSLAIALTFSVISNIRYTSDTLFSMSDKNKYYIDDLEGYTYMTSNRDADGNVIINRSVGAETIIPTIYRYNKENFGVTIFDKDLKPVARFDVETEGLINNWESNINNNKKEDNKKHIDYLNTYVNPKRLIGDSSDVWSNSDGISSSFYDLAPTKLYIVSEDDYTKRKISTPWLGNEENIYERIKVDIYGGETKSKYKGKNLIENYLDNNKFTEYFVFVPQLKEDGTKDLDKTDKLEIIYVQE